MGCMCVKGYDFFCLFLKNIKLNSDFYSLPVPQIGSVTLNAELLGFYSENPLMNL